MKKSEVDGVVASAQAQARAVGELADELHNLRAWLQSKVYHRHPSGTCLACGAPEGQPHELCEMEEVLGGNLPAADARRGTR
jgi:hypothetical protein